MAKTEVSLAKKISLPSRVGQAIGKEVFGSPYVIYPWLAYAEQRIIDAVMDFEHERYVIVNAPPQVGKSSYIGILLPFWLTGMFPQWQIMYISYSDDFSTARGKDVRALHQTFGKELFNSAIDPDFSAATDWRVVGGRGGMLSVGVGGQITGRPGHVIIIDDLIKNAQEAASQATKKLHVTEWDGTINRRMQPGGTVIIIACMTGDTPVLMADGATKPLAQVRPGDRVITTDDGQPTTSTILNWINQGPDTIYEVRMSSGRRVRGNARHPFRVIDENGAATWVRLGSLKAGMRVRSVTAPTPASSVPSQSAVPQRSARACACPTTAGLDGPRDTDRPRTLSPPVALPGLSIAMGSPSRNTTDCSPSKTAGVLSVENARMKSGDLRVGPMSSASITTMTPESSAGFCATTATSSLPERTRHPSFGPPSSIWNVGTDEVVEVVEVGAEDVFDIEVDRTHSFIANGLEVHNTRWAEDDLSGVLIERMQEPGYDGPQWEVIDYPAFAEPPDDHELSDDELLAWRDVTGRRLGEVLDCRFSRIPGREPEDFFTKAKAGMDVFTFSNLYQQRPSAREGGMFPVENWQFYDPNNMPQIDKEVRVWDMAATEGGGDWTCGVKVGRSGDKFYIIDVRRFRKNAGGVQDEVKMVASLDGYGVKIKLEEEKGGSGKSVVEAFKRLLVGYTVESAKAEGDKESRATPYSAEQNKRRVFLPNPGSVSWDVRKFVDEHKRMMGDGRRPRNDDQIDTAAYAMLELLSSGVVDMWIPTSTNFPSPQAQMASLMGQSPFR